MIFEKDGNISIITQEKVSIVELVKKLFILYSRFEHDNVIVNLTCLVPLTSSDMIEFINISNNHRKSKKSFLIVTSNIKLEDIPEELFIVPTIQEAYDVIEMEEIERDLDF
ncbi:ribonuclease Z [Flavobacteriaceae bacterium]|jgi:hypothetical protein|nr:ribonuclease Z [Flavobacteriaceae bacterium]